ncbi:MAG TPA: response regulator [Terriglobia bacterium]|nr:response regulator [Terriglobia bacterium]
MNSISVQGRPRVLVAEHDDTMRCSIVELLCKDFQVVGAVCDGEELVQSAICLVPDVIVTDVFMPRMDGLAARTKLLTKLQVIPFVFISTLVKEVVQPPGNDFPVGLVHKRDISAHLSNAVAAVLSGRSYVSGHYRE